jgi:ABC-type multidrug transport system fused ATPase/permease subunit
MTSIERIKEYLSVKTEKLNKDDDDDTTITSAKRHHQALPKSWPQFGAIRFEDVSFTYDSSLPYVFKNLSLSIRPGEKIGVVGRTGAGKSSLLQTLFRFGQYNGKVFIDDVDIKTISLYNLRNKIAIIPVIHFSFI